MRDNTAYKNEALAALKGNWAPSVLATIVYVVAVMLLIAPYEIKFFLTDPTDLSAARAMSVFLGIYILGIFLELVEFVFFGLVVVIIEIFSLVFRVLLGVGPEHFLQEAEESAFGRGARLAS